MCGIVGVVEPRGGAVDAASLGRALGAIAHRGPDGSGSYIPALPEGNRLGLGHVRLSIFDLSSAGRQPMFSPAGRAIVYNGEVFNWPEIRAELEADGVRFSTQTDTEVVLAAYERWGEDGFSRFNGFWSFAIYDPVHPAGARIVFSRDRLGIKPLYFARTPAGGLIAASECRALWAYLGQTPRVQIDRLARYALFDLIHDDCQTIYTGVTECEPGTSVVVGLRDLSTRVVRYWRPERVTRHATMNARALQERFDWLVEDAARLWLRSDRPVALTLSGGVDSSVLAVAARRAGVGRIRAFTSHFPGHNGIDESHYARHLAQKLDIEHELVVPERRDLRVENDLLASHQELPFASFSQLVNWSVMREVRRRGYAVYMTGQGGDELFMGYERYFASRLASEGAWPPSFMAELLGAAGRSRLSPIEVAGMAPYFLSSRLRTLRLLRDAHGVFSDAFMASTPDRPRRQAVDITAVRDEQVFGEQLRRLLRYDDRSASAFGIEGRPALLDHRLVEFARELPWSKCVRGGWTKILMRRYLARAGVPAIAWRRAKLGYAAPTAEWTDQLLKTTDPSQAADLLPGVLKSGLSPAQVPRRLRFKILNLLTCSRVMKWRM